MNNYIFKMDVIESDYIEMFPITNKNNDEINKSFDSLDEHKYYDFNFDINKRDENENSLLHRLIINSFDENDAINKFLILPINVQSLYNKQNNNLQTPLHLICIKRYHKLFDIMVNRDKERRRLIKNTLELLDNKMKVNIKNSVNDSSFDLFNYSIKDKYGNIPLVYLLNGNEISYDNMNPYLVFKSLLLTTEDVKYCYKNTNKLILNDDNLIFKDFEYLKDFILLLSSHTNNLSRYHFNSSFDISIQSFINSFIVNDFDYLNYYKLLIEYLLNKVKLDTKQLKHPIYYYQVYSIINNNPYIEIIKEIINIEEYQQILSDNDLFSIIIDLNNSNLSIKDIINEMVIIDKNISINSIEIPLLKFIPIFKLFVKLYNKFYNQKNNNVDQFLIFNDISRYDSNNGLNNKYIINMIYRIETLKQNKNDINLILDLSEEEMNNNIKDNLKIDKDAFITEITNKTYTNNYNSNMQAILNKSTDIKIAYKANINKFNNIIIQNIDKFIKQK